MTAQSKKTEQKRLDSCVLALPRRPKIHEKLKTRSCGTVKIKNVVANVAVIVAKTSEKGQALRNTKLLGKYWLTKPDTK